LFFAAINLEKTHGKIELWNVGLLGMKSGKRSFLQRMLGLQLTMMPLRHPYSEFSPENTPLLQENQYEF
jgi:hypothetical protein